MKCTCVYSYAPRKRAVHTVTESDSPSYRSLRSLIHDKLARFDLCNKNDLGEKPAQITHGGLSRLPTAHCKDRTGGSLRATPWPTSQLYGSKRDLSSCITTPASWRLLPLQAAINAPLCCGVSGMGGGSLLRVLLNLPHRASYFHSRLLLFF